MVVGAMAVAMWGRPRATAALDSTVLSDEAGLDAPARAVSQRGVRIDDAWLNSNPLLRGQHVRLTGPGAIIDLMRPRDDHEMAAIARRRRLEAEGQSVAVVAPEGSDPHEAQGGAAARLGLSAELGWVLDAASGADDD